MEHHVAIVVSDRIYGGERAMVTRGPLHKSILSSSVFPISSMGNVVPQVLDITLVIILKMFNVSYNILRVRTLHQMNLSMMKVIKSIEKKVKNL